MPAHLVVGGVSLALDLLLLVALHGPLGVPAATAVAFASSVVVNFLLNRAVHLQGRARGRQVVRYGLLLGVNAAVTLAIVGAGHRFYLEAKLLAVAVTTSWNYPLYRRWVFT